MSVQEGVSKEQGWPSIWDEMKEVMSVREGVSKEHGWPIIWARTARIAHPIRWCLGTSQLRQHV